MAHTNSVSDAHADARRMLRDRAQAGFTMMEMLAVIAITVILMGVAFVGGYQAWVSMQQMELDATAKELYMAAQNHLALAESQGLIDSLSKQSTASLGTPEADSSAGTDGTTGTTSTTGTADADGVYYFVYTPDTATTSVNNPENKSSALSLMLPFGAIDETVRTSGSYVIRYQPSTGTVLDVFYAKDCAFQASDYASLMSVRGADHKSDRQRFGTQGAIIGYYGGEEGQASPLKLKAPTLQVVNGDTLYAKVTCPSINNTLQKQYNTNHGTSYQLQIRLMVEGKDSDAAMWFEYETAAVETGDIEFTVVLDDVTANEGRFYQVASLRDASHKKAGAEFIPGEDLKVYAWVTSTGPATVAKSATTTTNSLFASSLVLSSNAGTSSSGSSTGRSSSSSSTESGLSTASTDSFLTTSGVAAATASSDYVASIGSFRHLANLSGAVSHFNRRYVAATSSFDPLGTQYDTVTAKQTTDLNWSDFKGSASTHAAVRIWADGAVASSPGTFLPVALVYALDYNGDGHLISNVDVNVEDAAGLFGALNTSGTKVRKLELVDFNVASSAGAAGALAGTAAAGVGVADVLVRESLSSASASRQIAGATAAGGLIGSAAGATIGECAAAVYVTATASGGAAGGLVGASSLGTAITDSYSGGHTADGAYATATTGAGRMNVQAASGTAGGLVGTAASTTISSCYSTCSALGAAAAGGLVGSTSAGAVSNCYATGLVAGGTLGAFIGTNAGATLSGDWYFSFMNQGTGAVANAAASGVAAFDDSVEMYNVFATGSGAAIPYDSVLARNYNGTYPFRSISALRGTGSDVSLITVHYGDWPSPESLAKNYQG